MFKKVLMALFLMTCIISTGMAAPPTSKPAPPTSTTAISNCSHEGVRTYHRSDTYFHVLGFGTSYYEISPCVKKILETFVKHEIQAQKNNMLKMVAQKDRKKFKVKVMIHIKSLLTRYDFHGAYFLKKKSKKQVQLMLKKIQRSMNLRRGQNAEKALKPLLLKLKKQKRISTHQFNVIPVFSDSEQGIAIKVSVSLYTKSPPMLKIQKI